MFRSFHIDFDSIENMFKMQINGHIEKEIIFHCQRKPSGSIIWDLNSFENTGRENENEPSSIRGIMHANMQFALCQKVP